VQLDTSLNVNPADTMWVLRVPVCLNAACSVSLDVFSTDWFAEAPNTLPISQYTARLASYDRQARQTVEFLQRRGSGLPVMIGDLNTWEGPPPCADTTRSTRGCITSAERAIQMPGPCLMATPRASPG